MNEIVVTQESNLLSLTPEQRLNLLKDALNQTVEGIVRAANIVSAMEKAGDDLSHIPPGMLTMLRKIASGQMRGAVFTNYDGLLRSKIASLVVTDQDYLLGGGKVKVIQIGTTTDYREVDPRTLEPFQIKQVFGNGRIRTEAEQVSYLETCKAKLPTPIDPDILVKVDKKRGKLVISGPVELSSHEITGYLQQML